MPSRTPSNGLERANQNETFQPEPWALGFVFIPTFAWLRGEIGTRSKRNFHRPESNCGVAINCACEAFIVDQQTSQMLAPARLLELIRDPRIMAAAVANATTALTNGLSAANQ
jgi:hypothetical protein